MVFLWGVISQRPSEIDSTILSQCNTLFVMRMANDLDQKIVLSAISDAASSLLEFLPSLGTGECIIFGDGVTLPVRMRFDRLSEEYLPRSSTAKFTESWRESGEIDDNFLENVVARWRAAGTPTATALGDKKVAEALPMEEATGHDALQQPAMSAPVMPVPQAPNMGIPVVEPAGLAGARSKSPINDAIEEKERIRQALKSKSRFFK